MPIDPKSVRIGNMILREGQKVALTASDLLGLQRFEGISITPVVLNQLRFIESRDEDCWIRQSQMPMKIYRHPDGHYFLYPFENGPLRYAHELQNLVYDLLGESTEEFDITKPTPPILKPSK